MLKKKIFYFSVGALLLMLLGVVANKFVSDIPASFETTESIETSLKTHLLQISGSKKMVLATLKHFEIFEKKSEMSLFNDRLKLPDIIVRASMPVEYNYFVDFDDRWDITTSEKSMTIIAPPLQGLLPAVNVSEIEFEVKKGSFFRRDSIVTEELRQELDTLLAESARGHLPSIREIARLELKELVEVWSANSGAKLEIKILFADEIEATVY